MRQQRRERDQAKWRSRIFGAEDFSGSFEIPKRVGIKSRVDQKRVARFWHSIPFQLEHLSPKIQGRWKWYASPHQSWNSRTSVRHSLFQKERPLVWQLARR